LAQPGDKRMTHDELLKDIDDQEFAYDNLANALRRVVELHMPIKDEWIEYTTCKACRVGDDDHYSPEYPCPTIQAIEKELN
jgi:predicted DNA-binding ribbon-helix-helix protein